MATGTSEKIDDVTICGKKIETTGTYEKIEPTGSYKKNRANRIIWKKKTTGTDEIIIIMATETYKKDDDRKI